MRRSMTRLVMWLAALSASTAFAQTPESAAVAESRLRVYLDGCECFEEFLRDQIRWVDFVRQQQDADAQFLSSRQQTGSGGTEVILRMVGLGRFAGSERQFRVLSAPNES